MSLRPLVVAAVMAFAVATGGLLWESARFGLTDGASARRLEEEVRSLVSEKIDRLSDLAYRVASEQQLIADASLSREHLADLFSRLAELAGTTSGVPEVSTTVYQSSGPTAEYRVLAWSEGPAEMLADERLRGPASLFVAPGPSAVRLVYVEPVEVDSRRVAMAAAETVLASLGPEGRATLSTSFGPVTIVPRYFGAGSVAATTTGFVIDGPTGVPLVEVQFDDGAVAAARRGMRRAVLLAAALPLGFGVLTLVVPSLERRRRAAGIGGWWVWSLLGAATTTLAVGGVAVAAFFANQPQNLTTMIVTAGILGVVAIVSGVWWRPARRRRPGRELSRFVVEHLAAGLVVAAAVVALRTLLSHRAALASFESWQSALFPIDWISLFGIWSLLLAEIAIGWIAASTVGLVAARWRGREPGWLVVAAGCWSVPGVAVLLVSDLPREATLVLLAVAAGFGASAIRLRRYYRRGTQSLRLGLGFLAVVVPLIAVYPMSVVIDEAAIRGTIEGSYAGAVAKYPEELRARLGRAQSEIDRIDALADRVRTAVPGASTLAFWVWSQTNLSRTRVSSDVELYGPDRALVSRSALNLPDYLYRTSTETWLGTNCDWEMSGELNRVGATEQPMLHAQRGVCDANGNIVGAVVVHVVPTDYNALPFVSSPSPYGEILGAGVPLAAAESRPADLQLVVYGWSLRSLFPSDARHPRWTVSGAIADRLYASGAAFWTELAADDRVYHVHFSQNRAGIYALGYPKATAFGHLTRLAEIAALAAVLFIAVQTLGVLYALVSRRPSAPLRVLFDEIRTSFYRKLFLFFVLVAIGPVLVFALAFGAYMTAKARADVETEAKNIASVAQRVLEEVTASEQPPGQARLAPTDDVMVWIRQVIGQDVNLFEGSRLAVTSQRDLFDSGLLPTRTLASVYRAVVLERMPTFVGEDHLGGASFLVAAAPLRESGRDAVLTVPLAPRQREIEREINELNRGVLVGSVLVVLLAAGLGASLAGRVSDPVARLTRAARQIAAGRLDVRIEAGGADELRRLIDDFNAMTEMLAAQRAELARTNQIKAWNEMARQVAHEIKNPLTPIQLAAEHLERVHLDQGRPLGAVLNQCVNTILNQVRLLRQIASEFANFAAEPVPTSEALSLADLIAPIMESYGTGLSGRIAFVVDLPSAVSWVRADRILLSRALTNLVENAVQAMPEGGTLRASARATDGEVSLTIEDSGVGMDESTLARAFEPYFSTKTGGSGLGLANAKRNVERQGGAISMTSRAGAGTAITITLPRAEAPRDGSETGSAPVR